MKKIDWKKWGIIVGIICRLAGILDKMGMLPNFKKDPTPQPKIIIMYDSSAEGDTPVQKILIPTNGDTTEIHMPIDGKMMEVQ